MDADGNWTDAGNWTGDVPNGAGDTANLTTELTAGRTLSLSEDITLGTLVIENDRYSIGGSTTDWPELIFDNDGAAATLTVQDLHTDRDQDTTFRHPLRVADELIIDLSTIAGGGFNSYAGFIGDADAHIDLTYLLSTNNRRIDLRNNQDYTGTVDLYRADGGNAYRSVSFIDNDGVFAGGTDSIRVHSGVSLTFRDALTDTIADRFVPNACDSAAV